MGGLLGPPEMILSFAGDQLEFQQNNAGEQTFKIIIIFATMISTHNNYYK
ncbi:hypothetical protein [Chitinophaga filiformis]|uniref:Uncharacterized protein n=1 Tax=Chitinophaga filiformis TaxID=104663 RepID=A0A1G8BRU3_CHIFI|nr:hypothetical protein [Chitinophaga filiformis]SDH35420.1 hypothetical protein SAMN04488121_111124 [Chitinophaga filiformis]